MLYAATAASSQLTQRNKQVYGLYANAPPSTRSNIMRWLCAAASSTRRRRIATTAARLRRYNAA